MKQAFTVAPFSREAQDEILHDLLAEMKLRDCPRLKQEIKESFARYSRGFGIREWIPVP
jgi:hypothetical protein